MKGAFTDCEATLHTQGVTTDMKTSPQAPDRNYPLGRHYALRRGLGFWELTFEGRQAIFKHELGALYVACLLLDPPSEPLHAVALALKAREMGGQAPGPAEVIQQRSMGLDDAAAVRALWRRQRALERVLRGRPGKRAREGRGAARTGGDHRVPAQESVAQPGRRGAVRPGRDQGHQAPARPAGCKRWTPRASRIRCCGALPCISMSTCWFPRAGAVAMPGRRPPRDPPAASATSRRPA